jgi:hypothetical protein
MKDNGKGGNIVLLIWIPTMTPDNF